MIVSQVPRRVGHDSQFFADTCGVCGEPIRILRSRVGRLNFCERCRHMNSLAVCRVIAQDRCRFRVLPRVLPKVDRLPAEPSYATRTLVGVASPR